MKKKSEKLWQGRSKGDVDSIMVEMGESISLDIELYREDIFGSSAHARMLHKCGVLSEEELEKILHGLRSIYAEIEQGKMELRFEMEDIHTHVENRLIELTGEVGKKLHTARSRNDQIAVDTHLFVRRAAKEIADLLIDLCETLFERAEQNIDTIIPAYTHLQVAQPVRLSHFLLAHFWTYYRDFWRFAWAQEEACSLPLGSGALSGVNYDTNREFLRDELDFRDVYPNSMDAVATRDHILNFLYASSVFMVHASRLSEEIILWNSVEFSFISLPDSLTTGSSIMPQKKNPDLAELSRGKAGRVFSNLGNLLTTLKGLPYAYNRDLQEDRFPLLDSRAQSVQTVKALTAMVREMKFRPENMERSLEKGFSTATDLADALVLEKNVPFREAHHLVGQLIGVCAEKGFTLKTVPEDERGQISEYFADNSFFEAATDVHRSADKKISYGGTALNRQQEQIKEAKFALAKMREYPWASTDFSNET